MARPKTSRILHAFHKLSLVALLAWVGLGADGLSSCAYGPDEAFRALGEHTGLAVLPRARRRRSPSSSSATATAASSSSSLGRRRLRRRHKLSRQDGGVISGSALLVDYILTITISDRLAAPTRSSASCPESATALKLPVAFAGVALLTVMNIRGVKESVTALVPVFALFVVTHAMLLVVGASAATSATLAGRSPARCTTTSSRTLGSSASSARSSSSCAPTRLGGGTYTGIEAVSNGVGMIMREPRSQTAQAHHGLMALSLAITAGGILALLPARPRRSPRRARP